MADPTPAERLLGTLGLARRAGRLVVGTRSVLRAARDGDLDLVVVAADAGDNALDRLRPVTEGPVPTVRAADRRSLGEALGRDPVVVVGLTDTELADKVRRLAGSGGREAAGRARADGPAVRAGDGRARRDAQTKKIHAS